MGLSGAATTTITSTPSTSLLTVTGGQSPSSSIQGFTLRGGHADYGGGLHLVGSGFTVTDCVFTLNTGVISGGGVYAEDATLVAQDTTFFDNAANTQGGGIAAFDTTLTVTGGSIEANLSLGAGAGLVLSNASAGGPSLIQGVLFHGNQADQDGGGALLERAVVEVLHNTFSSNSANDDGGGLYMLNASPGTDLHNNVFVDNEADESSAIQVFGTGPTVRSNTIVSGLATGSEPAAVQAGLSRFRHNIVAYEAGWGVDNGSPSGTIQYNDVTQSGVQNWHTDITGTAGNVDVDPAFVNYSSTTAVPPWDFTLSPTSPLLDAGDPTESDPDGSVIQLGAFGGPDGDWVPQQAP